MPFPEFQNDNPAARLAAYFQSQWEAGTVDMAEINPALSVEALGFTRYRGDWLGVVITPWFLRLFLLPGGGELWGDIPLGHSRYISLPLETMQFVADQAPAVGPFQYSTLLEPASLLSDMEVARQMALRVMQSFGEPAPAPAALPEVELPAPAGVSRRGFFRRLAGKR